MRSVVETILKLLFRRCRGEFVVDMTSSRMSIQRLHLFPSYRLRSSSLILAIKEINSTSCVLFDPSRLFVSAPEFPPARP
jgi:hypothetical protein